MSDIVILNGYKIKDEKAVRSYESIAQMKADTKLKEGYHVKTKGYYEANDGGHGEYIIVDDETLVDDSGLIHTLNNGLRAVLVIDNEINIKQYGAKSDEDFDNSTIINTILSKYLNVYIPEGKYKVSSTINMELEYQRLNCDSKARLESYNFTGDEILYINNNYIEINNLIIINTDETETINGINNNGFNTTLNTVTVTGTGKRALENNQAELRIYNSKFRGHYAGIYNNKPDLYMSNVYIEQNTHNGFTSIKGSIEAHHVHSYKNGGKGFYLVGADFSNFYGCYADTNEGNGFELNSTKNCNFIGCWDYKSNQSVGGYGITVTQSYKNNFIGCKSTSGGTSSSGSFKFTNTSYNNLLIGCESDKKPSFDNLQRVMNCYDTLLKYNGDNNNYYINNENITNAQTESFSCKVILDTISTPGVRVFKLMAPIRKTSANNFSYLCSAYLVVSDSANLNTIIYENDTNTYITISNVSLTAIDSNNNIYDLSFDITNNYSDTIQLGGQIDYIGTTRSYL